MNTVFSFNIKILNLTIHDSEGVKFESKRTNNESSLSLLCLYFNCGSCFNMFVYLCLSLLTVFRLLEK